MVGDGGDKGQTAVVGHQGPVSMASLSKTQKGSSSG